MPVISSKREKRTRIVLSGEIPTAIDIPARCRFATRCFRSIELCWKEVPRLKPVEREHLVARGRDAAERIRADARVLAEQEFVVARKALRNELIEEAVRQATALLRQTLTPRDQARMVRDFIESARAV